MESAHFPTEEEQFAVYKEAVQLCGKELTIRTLDIGGDKALSYYEFEKEENPFLGWRAIRISLELKDMFRTQLRAILRASAFGVIRIMFPKIISLEELRMAKELLEECKQELKEQNIACDQNIETGMLLKLIEYSLIFIIFGNIEAYLTNYYRRKQFADSMELVRLSITDSLTGIYNRTKFDQELNLWIDNCNRNGNSLSLIMLDIDDFKKVNDNYGHLIGDKVLQNITSMIKNAIRATDIFARWGGEEFVVLLPNTGIRQALEITERVRICIRENKAEGVENVTCSFGLVSLEKNENAESLLKRADKFLYKAKEQGKNTVAFF
jgi:diguanylate cyclase (GGDEF)-like protein